MASYYDLLEIASTADAETIKSAFRREIARYHPDKVQHLGREFQVMAAERAATLTAAYKTLLDPALRAEYDAQITEPTRVAPPPTAPVERPETPHAQTPPSPPPAPPPIQDEPAPCAAEHDRFKETRANRDIIMVRTILDHVRQAVADTIGAADEGEVRGFDLVFLPKGGGGLLRAAVPMRVLARFAPHVDGALASEMWSAAARARLHLTGAPLCVLLIGETLAPVADIAQAVERQRARRIPGTPRDLAIVPVDVRDWTARVPPDALEPVRRLAVRLQDWKT